MIKGQRFLIGLILSTANLFYLGADYNQKAEKDERLKPQAAIVAEEGLTYELGEDIQEKSCKDEYDYIIVGTGTAGCVLARQLSDNHRNIQRIQHRRITNARSL